VEEGKQLDIEAFWREVGEWGKGMTGKWRDGALESLMKFWG
jgi:hypothetical protein